MKERSQNLKELAGLFLGGASAGLVVFMLFGGVWQVQHFWWLMSACMVTCGLLAVVSRLNFEQVLDGLLDNAPWL